MRVLIVDDEPPARRRLRRLLEPITDLDVVGEASDGRQALELVAQCRPEAIFLDVQMPEASGLEVAASLPDPTPAIVFVTAWDRHALDAFDAGAVDYLLKPVDPSRLARAVERLRIRLATHSAVPNAASLPGPQQLLVPERGRVQVVRTADIQWLEAADNYVVVHTPERALLMRRTLAGLLRDLGGGFVRTHRSAAVALRHVASITVRDKGDADILLAGGAVAPCSRSFREALMERLQG